MSYSTEQAARLVQIASFLLGFFNVKIAGVEEAELVSVLAAVLFAGATAYGWWKRYGHGDISFGGFRK